MDLFLFEATALMNLLFGTSDFTSRLVPVILGMMIVIIMPRLLRPWLGQIGALATSVLLLISPFILYFSCYIRHDILVIAWTLLAVTATVQARRYLRPDRLRRGARAARPTFSFGEISFFYL